MAKAAGIVLRLNGDFLTWSADRQPPPELLADLKSHKLEIIKAMSPVDDQEQRCNAWRITLYGAPLSMMIGEPMTETVALETACWHWPDAQVIY